MRRRRIHEFTSIRTRNDQIRGLDVRFEHFMWLLSSVSRRSWLSMRTIVLQMLSVVVNIAAACCSKWNKSKRQAITLVEVRRWRPLSAQPRHNSVVRSFRFVLLFPFNSPHEFNSSRAHRPPHAHKQRDKQKEALVCCHHPIKLLYLALRLARNRFDSKANESNIATSKCKRYSRLLLAHLNSAQTRRSIKNSKHKIWGHISIGFGR